MPIKETSWKDERGNEHPMLELTENEKDKNPFSFGIGKALRIQNNIEELPQAINDFLEKNKK